MTLLGASIETLDHLEPMEIAGSVASVRGLTLLVDDLTLPVGSLVRIESETPLTRSAGPLDQQIRGEVVGFDGAQAIVMLLAHSTGIAPGAMVVGEQHAGTIGVGRTLLGRVIDGLGRPLDDRPRPVGTRPQLLHVNPTSALKRRRIDQPLPTGVRVIDSMLTLGRGQRVGVFAGPGVGKSTLLGTIARNTSADINVIALIGERGREVRDFIEHALGPEGLARSVVVVATGDQSPLLRVRAAFAACSVAEYFRDSGADVMLMMDSITRFAQAQRQIGLSVGEQPATKGYTPSVFSMLPMLLERAGAIIGAGSITGLYAVLVEGDDFNEPISDAARGILDGHIMLSRRLASRGHFPAVQVLESISRVADDVTDIAHQGARRLIQRLLAAYAESEELINIGAYARGSNPACDAALAMKDELDGFLQQSRAEKAMHHQTCRRLIELAGAAERLLTQASRPQAQQSPAGTARKP